MTTTNDHPILAKVRKLLALAEDPAATTHESRPTPPRPPS